MYKTTQERGNWGMDLESIFNNLKKMNEDEIKKSVTFSLIKKAENDKEKNLFYEFDITTNLFFYNFFSFLSGNLIFLLS